MTFPLPVKAGSPHVTFIMEQDQFLTAAYRRMAELLRQAEEERLAQAAKLADDAFSHSLRHYLGEKLIQAGEWLTSVPAQPADDCI